jgi:hypothetical protein
VKKVFIPRQMPKYVSKDQIMRRMKAEMRSSFSFLRFWEFWKKQAKRKKRKK